MYYKRKSEKGTFSLNNFTLDSVNDVVARYETTTVNILPYLLILSSLFQQFSAKKLMLPETQQVRRRRHSLSLR